MHAYTRPPVPHPVFHDAAGAVIPYGERWKDRDWDGPDETYSVTVHPERFAPFVKTARAILGHLEVTYDVRREDAVEGSTTWARLIPRDPTAAPLTFAFNPFPMVEVTGGVTTTLGWFCTCDHCDEDVEIAIDTLEEEISAVVDGRLREWLNDPAEGYAGDELFLAHSLLDGSGSSSVRDAERAALRARFAAVPPRWAPWTLS